MADGGEGTVQAFIDTGASAELRRVRGPLGEPVEAIFAIDGMTAIIEMSAASGLMLVPEERRNPKRASTFGTGQLIAAALDGGAERVVVGVGGSATNDAGAGMLQALGARLFDETGNDLPPGGAALARLATIDLSSFDRRLRDEASSNRWVDDGGSADLRPDSDDSADRHPIRIDVAADVDNPLCGPNGASAVFGPQKGATLEDVAELDAALSHFADVAARTLGVDRRDEPGSGAAGGIGFALLTFCGATLRPGVEIVAELRGLPAALEDACAVFTGEGSIDEQTLAGKAIAGVARLARTAGVPTIVALGGRVERNAAQSLRDKFGVIVLPITTPDTPAEQSMRDAANFLEEAARAAARSIAQG